jgi:hypothetical protein
VQVIQVVILQLKVTLEAKDTQTAQPIQQVVVAAVRRALECKSHLQQVEQAEQVLLLILLGFQQ